MPKVGPGTPHPSWWECRGGLSKEDSVHCEKRHSAVQLLPFQAVSSPTHHSIAATEPPKAASTAGQRSSGVGAGDTVHGTQAVGCPHLPGHCQGNVVQPPSEHFGVTGGQALDAQQALLLHLPGEQGGTSHCEWEERIPCLPHTWATCSSPSPRHLTAGWGWPLG